MATWKISGLDMTSAGLSGLKITFRNRVADEATFIHDGMSYDGNTAFLYGQTYAITRDGLTVFAGRCVSIPRQATGKAESISYVLKGGWWWLDQILYRQKWPTGEDNIPATKTRILLGYDDDGNEIGANAQLRDILQCARSNGALLDIGIINVSNKVLPHDEQVDLTCAQAVDRILAWYPDTAVYFDYGTTPPTINMVRRANLTPATVGTANVADEVSITPRYDIQVPGVKIIYEIISGSDSRVLDIVEDTAGNPDAFGAMIYTVQLAASSASRLWQSINSDGRTPLNLTNYAGNLGDPTRQRMSAKEWWVSKIPELQGWQDVTLHDQEPSKWPPMDGLHTLDYELRDGEVQDWMSAKRAVRVTAKVKADYTLNGKTVKDQTLSYTLTLTNAGTGIYSAMGSYVEADKVPEGIAKEVFAALNQLHYEGKIVLISEEPQSLVGIRNVLNLSGGHADWAGMRACIQTVSWSVDSGTTTVSFGPPDQLGVSDRVQMALANRRRSSAHSVGYKRSSKIEEEGGTIGGPGGTSNSTSGGEYTLKQNFGDPEQTPKVSLDGQTGKLTVTSDGGSLTLDPSAEPETLTVITGIVPELKLEGESIQLKLKFTGKTLKKISNGWAEMEDAVIPDSETQEIELAETVAVTDAEVSGTTLKFHRSWILSLGPEREADTKEIAGEECE